MSSRRTTRPPRARMLRNEIHANAVVGAAGGALSGGSVPWTDLYRAGLFVSAARHLRRRASAAFGGSVEHGDRPDHARHPRTDRAPGGRRNTREPAARVSLRCGPRALAARAADAVGADPRL